MLKNLQTTQTTSYQRRKPEESQLYQIIEDNYQHLADNLSKQKKILPSYINKEFERFLECGRLENGFLRVRCQECHHEKLVAFSCKKRGFCPSCGASKMAQTAALLTEQILPHQPIRQYVLSLPFPLRFLLANQPALITPVLKCIAHGIEKAIIKKSGFTQKTAQTGAVTFIQRFGSALNLNIHFHMLFLDGVYLKNNTAKSQFVAIKAMTASQLNQLLSDISHKIIAQLEQTGVLIKEGEQPYLNLEDDYDESGMKHLQGSAVTYRIATGSLQGQKTLTLKTLPPIEEQGYSQAAKANGFSLHAGVVCQATQRKKLERLCRYTARGALSEARLSRDNKAQVIYKLKTPYHNGTTHVVFSPLEFIARLAALIPPPKLNLTRFHGVFAPNHKLRQQVIIGKPKKKSLNAEAHAKSPTFRLTWAQRLKRVFSIDIEACEYCGGKVSIIATIKDPLVIKIILDHIEATHVDLPPAYQTPQANGPPVISLR